MGKKIDMLVQAGDAFDRYATNHFAKEPPQIEKGRANVKLALACFKTAGKTYLPPKEPDIRPTQHDSDLPEYMGTVTEYEPILPASVAEVTGNIAEGELAARWVEQKVASAREKSKHAGSQDTTDRLDWVARILTETAYELRTGMHLPEVHIDGRVIPYNEDRGTNVYHADAMQLFFNDVYSRNVKAGWWTNIETGEPKKRNVGELFMLMVTELAEAYDGYLTGAADEKVPEYPEMGVEIGDLLIRVADFAGALAAGNIVAPSNTRNPGDAMFNEVCMIAKTYERTRKTPEAVGDAEQGDLLPPQNVGAMIDAKLLFNSTRKDHSIAERLKSDGKRT